MAPMSVAFLRKKKRLGEIIQRGLRMANSLLISLHRPDDRGEYGLYIATLGEEDAEPLPYGRGS